MNMAFLAIILVVCGVGLVVLLRSAANQAFKDIFDE